MPATAALPRDLSTGLARVHDEAYAALDAADAGAPAAVAWCSAHLVAAERVLHVAARRALPDGQRRLPALRSADHRLKQAVCRLDRRLTGDMHLSSVPMPVLLDEVHDLLEEHARFEQRLVDALTAALDDQEEEELVRRLDDAMQAAPTRPHPHLRHVPLDGLVARLDACVDRVRDVMDNRVVPTPHRVRAARVPGRWGCYLMGRPCPPEAEPGR